MTTFFLIRHAAHGLLGRTLAGRTPHVHLSELGKTEARRLAEHLADAPLKAIYTSPLERAQETAWPLADTLMLPLRVHPGFDEINFGEWTGKTFPELDPLPEWQKWNADRGASRCTGGESMGEVQERIVRALEEMRARHRGEYVAIVSHGDVIKAALMHYLGIPLNNILRLEVGPASVNVLRLTDWGAHVMLINGSGIDSGNLQQAH